MKKASFFLYVLLSSCLLLCGCTGDGREVDDQVYTLVLGADKGVENKIRLTVQFPSYKTGEAKDDPTTGQIGGTVVATIEAPSLLEGIDLLNTATSRRISLVHTKAIIFSEKFARDGIKNYLEPIARYRETRRVMQVFVCKDTAEEFIRENKTLIGESPSKAMELMAAQSLFTGYFPLSPFNEFYRGVISPYEQPFAVYSGINRFNNLHPENSQGESPLKTPVEVLPGLEPRKGNRKIDMIGTAVFDGDKMVGNLDGSETRFLLMLTGRFQRGIITLPDKHEAGSGIPLDLRLARKPKVKAHFENSIPVIDVNLSLEADLGAIQSRFHYEELKNIGDLNQQIEHFIKSGIDKTIARTQKEWGTDIFGFGRKVAHSFTTVQEFEKYNWLKHYKDAKITVSVKANVRRTGLMIESSPIRTKDEDIITGDDK